jgi:hypothetical protein
MDQVLDAQAGTQGEMVLITKSEHVGDRLAALFPFFIGNHSRTTGCRFESPFHDFLGRAAHTAGERGFEQLLTVS